jgi:hypothetical protein
MPKVVMVSIQDWKEDMRSVHSAMVLLPGNGVILFIEVNQF